MTAAKLARFERYVDFTNNRVNYLVLFWQHPRLWAESLLKRLRDALLNGEEATAFVVTELQSELLRSIQEASNNVKELAELRSKIEIAQNELDDLVASKTALAASESGRIRAQLVALAKKFGKVLETVVGKMESI